MPFEKAENFLLLAAQKYRLDRQAKSSLVCERARKMLSKKYENLCTMWEIKKYEDHVLFVAAENASAKTELFMRTHEILEIFEKNDETFPEKIREIRIVRK